MQEDIAPFVNMSMVGSYTWIVRLINYRKFRCIESWEHYKILGKPGLPLFMFASTKTQATASRI